MEKAARGENGLAPFQVSQSHLEPPNLIFRCFGEKLRVYTKYAKFSFLFKTTQGL